MRSRLELPGGGRLLVAFSGGADSTALLSMLWDMRMEESLAMVAAAHFNHGLRPEAVQDEEHVRAFCAERGIPCFFGRADVASEAKLAGQGIEATARALRYEFLARAAEQAEAEFIVTAHTASDNVETVLLNLTRGTGVAGLRGIPPVRGNIARPMLGITRQELLQWLEERGLSYVEDASNAEKAYRRNRIRHDVVPVLREFNPQLERAVRQTTLLIRQEEDFFAGLTADAMAGAGVCPEGVTFSAAGLGAMHPALALRVCRAMCELAGLYCVEYDHLLVMLTLCASDSPHAAVSLPRGFTARRVYADLVVGPAAVCSTEKSVSVTASPAEREEDGENVHKSFNTFYVNADTIHGDLVVRPRRQGDEIALVGRNGTKTLKKLFIEEKIPVHLRDAIPVLADDNGVVAVCGFGIDRSRAPADDRPVLKITVRSEP